jgi:hypothetical protein
MASTKIIGRTRTSSIIPKFGFFGFRREELHPQQSDEGNEVHSSAAFGFTGDNPNDLDEVRMSAMGVGR